MIIGVDLGGTKIRAAGVGADGQIDLATLRERPTPAHAGPQALLDAVADMATEVARAADGGVSALGLAAAGVVDRRGGVILSSTSTLTGWAGTRVRSELARRLGRAGTAPVIDVLNDADAYGEAEAWVGGAIGATSALVVAVGTGVGGAVVIDGKVLTGAHRAAGEIGHIPVRGAEDAVCPCGRRGHLEAVASGRAIERAYALETGLVRSGRDIAQSSPHDAAAASVMVRAGDALGVALAGIVTTVDPEVIVLGGGLSGAGDIWRDAVDAALRAEVIEPLASVRVKVSALGEASPLIGAVRGLVEEGHR